ncbi:ATP-binding protein [Sphingomonas sp. IW22]|uniref:sensor histidine kinase n=1 Tax=Sphingomonas sp. IW22 TaxID=3242489 RepID=UPI003522E5B1
MARQALRESARRRWGLAALLIAALLLVVSAAIVNVSLGSLGQSRDAVGRTNSILRHTNELQAALRAAEAGQRRYLRTGEAPSLSRYEQSVRRMGVQIAILKATTRHPPQVARLNRIVAQVYARQAELAARATGSAPLPTAATEEALLDGMDTMFERFKRYQRERFADLVSLEARRARQTTIAAAASGFLSLFSAILGIYLIFRQRTADAIIRYSIALEEQVEERTRDLREVNRELDAFAYTISHDLRAPLRAIHGYSDALIEDYGELLPEEGRRFAGAMTAAALRMDTLIEDILAYTRKARREIKVTVVSLDEVVERACRDLLTIATGSPKVHVRLPLGFVVGQAAVLRQVIDNLLSNSLKFVVPGTEACVVVRSERIETCRRLWIEDNGIGIAGSHEERIFEPFERLHGIEAYPGTGIGLAIVRRGVERMGGKCGVESEPGCGSRFWIDLKAAEQEEEAG